VIQLIFILVFEVKDINLSIGIDMVRGESIIQDVHGLSLEIRRSLRDLSHLMPIKLAASASTYSSSLRAFFGSQHVYLVLALQPCRTLFWQRCLVPTFLNRSNLHA
jgi:hypothetical protein